MKTHITLEDLQAWQVCDPYDDCADPLRDLFAKPVSILDILTRTDGGWAHVPPEDRLWIVLHEGVLSDRILRFFACACAERALERERAAGREPDPRSFEAVAVSRRYADDRATSDELEDAHFFATVVAYDSAASSAARTVIAAARAAADAAAHNDADNDADYFSAAIEVAAYAIEAAVPAAAAERAAQLADLIELIKSEKAQP
jgi:hypothetical protein